MRTRRGQLSWLVLTLLVCSFSAPGVFAADGPLLPYHEYKDRIKKAEEINVLNDGLMGDSVSLYNGSTEFAVTDIDISGNDALPVQLRRRLKIESRRDVQNLGGFGIWDIDVPYIHGTFDGAYKWNQGVGGVTNRCSGNWGPRTDAPFTARDIGGGIHMNVPGQGSRELHRNNGNAQMLPLPLPTDGRDYRHVAKDGWRFSCLTATSNGYSGEGFLAVAPDGTRYTFDVGIERFAGTMSAPFKGVSQSRARVNVYLMASRVEDRFGNWVTYGYTGGKLTSISSKDGRLIELFYDGGVPYVTRARANGKEWTYQYTPTTMAFHATGLLDQVTLPDASTWMYDYLDGSIAEGILNPEYPIDDIGTDGSNCRAGTPATDQFDLTAKSPSGAFATFSFMYKRHRRSGTPASACVVAFQSTGDDIEARDHYRLLVPDYFDTYSLVQKTLEGPGLEPLSWSYTYPLVGGRTTSPIPCTTCTGSKTVTVQQPDGSREEHEFGILYGLNDGRLLQTRTIDAGGVLRRTVTQTYVSEAEAPTMPFADIVGVTTSGDDGASVRNRPVRSTVIEQDGVSFTNFVNTFDEHQRTLSVTKSNSLGASKVNTTEYHDDATRWVLGQVERQLTDGAESARTTFNTASLPWKTYRFGKLQHTLGYYADGTLKSVSDGRGYTTTLSGWKRGMPTSIVYADQKSQSAEVNDDGTLAWLQDENGFTTSYTYDDMGRLGTVTYPAGDTPSWTPLVQTFTRVSAEEYGIAAGHWRRTISHGNARKVTYYDAFWRPLLTREYDTANVAGTSRFSAQAFDHEGRVTFASYPVASVSTVAGVTQGTHTQYDVLGRVRRVEQDSELGRLVTTTDYVKNSLGYYAESFNPRLKRTRTWFQMFDAPAYESPVAIHHPEGAVTDIPRDVFGKPERIQRRNTDSTIALTRHYVYDGYGQLCKSIEPETGATLMGYDAAGNLAWSSAGLPLTSTDACQEADPSVQSRRVARSYDNRNRLTQLSFPDGNGDQVWTYWPDGQVKSVVTRNGDSTVTNAYTYNKRRLLTAETATPSDGSAWAIGYQYNSNGHLTAHSYPSGLTVEYQPNALGQATRAGTYATGVSYFPNGGMKQFTYGNGLVHTLQQNARGLPERSRDAVGTTVVLDDSYDYDANGNVMAISDALPNSRGNRDMTYDGLDRLKTTASPMFGSAGYTYDVLDNLKTVNVAGRNHSYVYDPTNRLTNVTNTVGGATVVGLGYDLQGNVSNKNGQQYGFDYGNRMREAIGKESYGYDAHGRRIKSTDAMGGSIRSMYGQDGVLRYQHNERKAEALTYITLNGSLVAEVVSVASPAAPRVSVSGYTNQSTYTVSWNAVVGATSYDLQESANGGAWTAVYSGSALSRSLSGKLTGGYAYRARACNAEGCSAWGPTDSISVELPPSGVATLSAPTLAANGDYSVTWTSVAGAATYTLEESSSGGSWVVASSSSVRSKTYTGRAAGEYSYRVKACNGGGCASYSAVKTVDVVYQPGGATVTAPATSYTGNYTVSWTQVAGATSYRLDESANSGTWTQIYSGGGTSAVIAGRGNGSYAYRVTVCNGAGCSAVSASKTVQVTHPPAQAPTLVVPSTALNGSYSISWSAVSTATRYVLEQSANSGTWTEAQDGAAISKAFSGIAAGTYAYRVKACNVAGCGATSTTGTVQAIHPPAAPTLTLPTSDYDGSYTVSWSTPASATSYRADERFNGGTWTSIHNAAGTSVARTGRQAGTWGYQVTACNQAGCSAPSAVKSTQVTLPPTSATSLTAPATNYSGTYTLSWGSVATATRYELSQRLNGGTFSTIYNGASTSSSVSGRTPGTWEYRVRGCNVGGCGPWSALKATQVIGVPGSTSITGVQTAGVGASYTVSWSAATNADSYQLQESANGGAWTNVSSSGRSKSFTKSAAGTYAYRVRACNPAGCGGYSATHSVSVTQGPPVPTGLAITLRGATECRVQWNASSGATSYNLKGPKFTVYQGSQNSFIYDAQCHTSYSVQACNTTGCSAWSAPVY